MDAALPTSSGRPAASPRGCWSSTTGAGPTSATCSASPTLLDPERRLRVVTPRAPLQLPGSPGYHWYLVPRVGYPDHDTFHAARAALAELHDRLWEETGIGPERTVLGGFSMGAVMSYAMALGADRPAVAGILAFSGFVPTVEGWEPSFDDRSGTARLRRPRPPRPDHRGRASPQRARELLEQGGLEVTYRESDARAPDRPGAPARRDGWLGETLASERSGVGQVSRGAGTPSRSGGGRSSGGSSAAASSDRAARR